MSSIHTACSFELMAAVCNNMQLSKAWLRPCWPSINMVAIVADSILPLSGDPCTSANNFRLLPSPALV